MNLQNSENTIRDIRTFCRSLFCHSSVVILHLCYGSEAVMRLDYQIILKSPPPLTLLARSAPASNGCIQ